MIVLDCLTIVVALVATLTCWRIMRRAESAAVRSAGHAGTALQAAEQAQRHARDAEKAAQAAMTLSIGFRVTAVEHQPDGTILITGASLT